MHGKCPVGVLPVRKETPCEKMQEKEGQVGHQPDIYLTAFPLNHNIII